MAELTLFAAYDRVKGPAGWQKAAAPPGKAATVRPFFMGNWKDVAPSIPATQRFFVSLRQALQDLPFEPRVAMAPPFTSLLAAAEILKRPLYRSVVLGAQDVHWSEAGKRFTGDIPASALRNLGVKFCIVGHSERREHHGETDQDVNRKGAALLAEEIQPVVCVGEDFKPQNAESPSDADVSRAWGFIGEQMERSYLEGRTRDQIEKSLVAYEPRWAIGTGLSARAEYADLICGLIRERIGAAQGEEVAARSVVLYGGSVNVKNVAALLAFPSIDGSLVGGASLNPVEFANLVRLGAGYQPYSPPYGG